MSPSDDDRLIVFGDMPVFTGMWSLVALVVGVWLMRIMTNRARGRLLRAQPRIPIGDDAVVPVGRTDRRQLSHDLRRPVLQNLLERH